MRSKNSHFFKNELPQRRWLTWRELKGCNVLKGKGNSDSVNTLSEPIMREIECIFMEFHGGY